MFPAWVLILIDSNFQHMLLASIPDRFPARAWGTDTKQKAPETGKSSRGIRSGDDLRSHTVAHAVSSALEGLTSVFGMGTGVAPPLESPETFKDSDVYGQPTVALHDKIF